MWGRFSGSTESYIDQDLAILAEPDGDLDKLINKLRLWHGGMQVEPGHFNGWSRGARFYPLLYLLTRMGEARDWGAGLPLKANLLGKMSKLELHHIFPKAQLRKRKLAKPEINALANFCFLTKETNLAIRDRLPEDYFPEVEDKHPGALASQWIPADKTLWKIGNYRDFLEARKTLLAEEANKRLMVLLHDDAQWFEGPAVTEPSAPIVYGSISSDAEEEELEELNQWMVDEGLHAGELSFDYADAETGEQRAVFDLAWPTGIQEGLSEPVAVLLNEPAETIAIANQAGFRCFTDTSEFKHYVEENILMEMIV